MVQNTTTLSSRTFPGTTKEGWGLWACNNCTTKKYETTTNKETNRGHQTGQSDFNCKNSRYIHRPYPSPSSFIFAIYFLAKTLSKNRSIDIDQDQSVQLVAANWPWSVISTNIRTTLWQLKDNFCTTLRQLWDNFGITFLPLLPQWDHTL